MFFCLSCHTHFPSYGVYISQLIRFARLCSNVDDFNNSNLFLTAKLLKQGYRYHTIRKAFSKFYHRHSELIVKYNIGLKTLLQQGISEPIFYGDLVYKFKRIVGKPNFSDQFKKIVKRYVRIGYNLDIMRQSACLVLNPITVYSYGFLFNCTTVGQTSDSIDGWLRMSLLPPPLGNFADISYLVENGQPHLLRDVCTLCSGALVCKSL